MYDIYKTKFYKQILNYLIIMRVQLHIEKFISKDRHKKKFTKIVGKYNVYLIRFNYFNFCEQI